MKKKLYQIIVDPDGELYVFAAKKPTKTQVLELFKEQDKDLVYDIEHGAFIYDQDVYVEKVKYIEL